MPFFSIVTATNNNESSIEITLNSLLNQSFTNYELIIIDNLSMDMTLKIIKKIGIKNVKILSERDTGIYNALNKGISNASGKIIHFLHSGDVYNNTNVLTKVYNNIQKTRADLVVGNVNFVLKIGGNVKRRWSNRNFNDLLRPKDFFYGWMPAHTATFVNRKIFDEVGNFDEKFKISADYEWFLRVSKKRPKINILDYDFIDMTYGGVSTKPSNIFLKLFEDCIALKKNTFSIAIAILKRIRKIHQLII